MPLGEEYLFLALILCILIGLLCSMVGLGGGILLIPASIFLFGFSPREAIFLSLFTMTGTTISASIRYMKMKLVKYRLSMLYNIWDIPGVIVGAILTIYLANNILAGMCGCVMLILAILIYRKKSNNKNIHTQTKSQNTPNENIDEGSPDLNEKNSESPKFKSKFGVDNIYIASLSSFSGGFITGLVGLGGGTADTTSMILLGLDPKTAAGTSEFAMATTVFFGVIVHFIIGTYQASWLWPIFMVIGAVIGAQIGPTLSSHVKSSVLRKMLSIFVFYTGILMILIMFGIGWTA